MYIITIHWAKWLIATDNVMWYTAFVWSRFRSAALAGLLVLGAGTSEAQPTARHILVLRSFDRGALTIDHLTSNFRSDLEQRTGSPLNIEQVNVGSTQLAGPPEQAVVDYIQSAFTSRQTPDLVVTLAAPAAIFARKHRQQLFPDVPILFAVIDQRFLREVPLAENEAAVAVDVDWVTFVDDILQLVPTTKHVFMVTGSGPTDLIWRRQLEGEFRRFQGRVTFGWLNDLTLPDLLRRCANLPSGSAIVYLSFGSDAAGGVISDRRVLTDLHATANAPVFGLHSVYVGHGIVGGTLLSFEDLGRTTADVAISLLNGAPAKSINIAPQKRGQRIFDSRELQRWGIAESRLPAGSVVVYRAPSLWREHRTTVLSAAGALIVQSLLIGGLLYHRRARQRAEIESRKNLGLAAAASRRQTMAALTNSITHELGQPLSAIIHNAQALQMMVTANRATSDTIGEILSDIQTQGVQATNIIDRHRTRLQSRQVEMKPTDLHAVINDSLALVGHEMTARQIVANVQLPANPCVVNGDPVLLEQVLVNLMMNAMDAMADSPRSRRSVTIRSDVKTSDVEVSVRDSGTGLPEQDGTLFTPFVTTKSHGVGIGLTIVRTIVEAHGGTIDARNNPDGGATFTVTLPCSATRESASLIGAA
jgi:signal transduction histidine kinase